MVLLLQQMEVKGVLMRAVRRCCLLLWLYVLQVRGIAPVAGVAAQSPLGRYDVCCCLYSTYVSSSCKKIVRNPTFIGR